jgi:hypothetical protein
MDTMTEARVGVNRIFQGIDESNINDHNRIGQLSTMASQRVEQIARIFGNGVQRLFAICHELIIKSGHKAEAIKLRGEWVEFDPKQWKTGRDMRVVAPFAAGNKDALLDRLMVHMGIHERAIAAGHPMVQVDDSYALAQEIAKATDIPEDRFYTDPATIPPQPPEPDYTAAALEIEALKVQNQGQDSERDAEIAKYKADLDASVEKYRADLNAQVQIALAEAKGEGAVNLEKVRANLRDLPIETGEGRISASQAFQAAQEANQTMAQTLLDALSEVREVVAQANAEKELVRDEAGNITGSRPVLRAVE